MEAVALLILGAVLGAVLGYFVRRNEHVRDKRLDAFGELLASFINAARTGAALLSVHMQTGFPHELSRETWSAEQIEAMSRAHSEAWSASAEAAHSFELAVARTELVASKTTRGLVTDLRDFLEGAIYSGMPWGYAKTYPTAKLNPVDIVPRALDVVRPHVHRTARELWGYSAPKPPELTPRNTKRPSGERSKPDATATTGDAP